MSVEILRRAEKQVEKLPNMVSVAIGKKIREMIVEQDNLQIKKMRGYDSMYRVRVGDYRIIYSNQEDRIEIVAVQHRKDVYRGKF